MKTAQDKLNEIEDLIVNQYGEDDGPFSIEDLTALLNAIVSIVESK